MEMKEQKEKKKMLPRKQLVVPKTNKCNSNSAFYSSSPTGNVAADYSTTDCMGSTFSNIRGYGMDYAIRIFVLPIHGLSVKDVGHWVMFINRCGFPCKFNPAVEGKSYIGHITFKRKDYKTAVHMHLGVTAARYCCMHYNKGYNEIPALATELYEKYEDLDAYQAFILAHYGTSVGTYFDAGHGVVAFSNGSPKLLTKEQLLKRLTTVSSNAINVACTEYSTSIDKVKLSKEAQKGNWDKVIENLVK